MFDIDDLETIDGTSVYGSEVAITDGGLLSQHKKGDSVSTKKGSQVYKRRP